jgi:hypothetical protein
VSNSPAAALVNRLGAGGQLLARDREAGPDARLGQLQLVEAPLGVAEPLGQRPDRPARPRGQPCPRDPQRQRQPPAPAGHVRRGLGLGGAAFLADQPAEQLDRVAGRQDVEVEVVGAVQAGEQLAAGDQRPAARRGRQQRCDLGGIGRVVQHHQQAPVGDLGAEHGAGFLQLGGDGGGVDAERAEEAAQDVEGLQRLQAGAGAVQVGVQLPVGEVTGGEVRGVDGQGGLADPGRAGDGRDRRAGSPPGAVTGPAAGVARRDEVASQHREEVLAAGEPGHVGGKLARRPRGRPGRLARWGPQGRVGAQDGPLQPLQRWAGFDAELADQELAGLLVGRERLGLPTRPVQRQHQQLPEALVERVLLHQAPQVDRQLGVLAQPQPRVHLRLERLQALLVEGGDLGVQGPVQLQVAERPPAPQRRALRQLLETEPPPSAIANLRTYASAVRRLLNAGSAGAATGRGC